MQELAVDNLRTKAYSSARWIAAVLMGMTLFMACAARAEIPLSIGSRGSDVVKVQQRLIQWGYLSGEADGVYGAATAQAVRTFQKANALGIDGKVGPATAAAIGISLSKDSASPYISEDHRLLARLVYAEARGESYLGQVAVAAVTLNRVKHKEFPNTLSGVIYQKNAFTCVNDGQFNLVPDATAIRAALEALNGADPTNGCTYYYNPVTAIDQWIRTRTVMMSIGNHVFAV